ncbi:MAG: ExeM/NucH family extracellular endonuclease [Cyanobacteria bacterium J06621_15]
MANDVIINEFTQGDSGAKEWIEILVVTDNFNLQNYKLVDGNGSLDLVFSGSGFASLKAGTTIVVYNGGDVDSVITPDLTYDPVNNDYKLVVSSLNNSGTFAITRNSGWSNTTGAFSNSNSSDSPQLLDSSNNTVFTFPSTVYPGSKDNSAYIGSDVAGTSTSSNWDIDTDVTSGGDNRTPGEPNGGNNTTWINSLRTSSGGSTPQVNLSVAPTTGTETNTTAITVTATASSAVTGNQTVNLALSGTADASDFTGTIPTTLTILDGQTTATFTVNVDDDALDEGSETATFTISSPSAGVALGSTVTGNVNITDNDGAVTPPSTSTVAINEIRIVQSGTDNDEYFELFGTGGESLNGLTYLVIGDGTGGSGVIEAVVDLTGQSIPTSGFFTTAESTFTLGTADLTTNLNFENSDNVTHLLVEGFTGANGDDLDTNDDGVLDTTPWTSIVDSVGVIETSGSGEQIYSTTTVGPGASGHIFRSPDGTGSWNIGQDSTTGGSDTPGAANATPSSGGGGGVTVPGITKIHDVQGSGTINIQDGNTVTIQGIVVGDFQGVSATATGDSSPQLRGFFVQEEGADEDGDPTTSEGIFVFDGLNAPTNDVDVNVGDLVTVTGLVQERNDNLAGEGLTSLKVDGSNGTVTVDTPNFTTILPTQVTLPETTDGELERYEGMLVEINDAANPMTVSQNFFLGRYGQLTLSSPDDSGTAGRLYKPTNLFDAGSSQATALADENARRILILDDGFDQNILGDNPNPVPYLPSDSNADANQIRPGATVTNLVGILDQGQINSAPFPDTNYDYRLQPTQAPVFTPVNTRTAAPDPITGRLKVGSFNVLNYFNGDGQGGGFPTARGADTLAEFERQSDKIVEAITALDADILGLMEIENDGYGAQSAIQELVDRLNLVAGAGTYAFVDPGTPQLGTDQIAVGFIYKPNVVTAVAGKTASLDTGAFNQSLTSGGSRVPLAQTFQENSNGETFTAVVNHFKSKRPPSSFQGDGNDDQGDGQGSWNLRRTEAANDLANWLATDPTNSGELDFLILGDLNAYAEEDPIQALEAQGYTNLVEQFSPTDSSGNPTAYSYIFDGEAGYLDHALANSTLTAQVTGATEWHINTDEPEVINYDQDFNPAGYYTANAYRSSDHDPVLIGLDLVETPGVVINRSGGSTDVAEGGATDDYTVVLNTQPTADVTVTIATGGQTTTDVTTLTFTPANWDQAQTVTVTAIDDNVVELTHNDVITHTVSSTDANYDGITTASVSVNITDNDTGPIKIHTIQGSGSASTLQGSNVTIEGIVVSDNQGGSGTGLSGFFVQEEDADADTNPLTSEGIFIFDGTTPAVDVNEGDLVQVTGDVTEFNGLTELTNVTVNVVSSGNQSQVTATDVNFPLTSVDDLESYEGMLINAQATTGDLTVTEHFNLDRFGEVLLSSGGRLEQFTQDNAPSVAGYTQHLEDIAKRSILIDDGRNGQNLFPIPNARGGNNLSPTNTLRGGDTVSSVTGALSYAFGEYRVQPTQTINYAPTNPRPTATPAVGGNIKVASFNLLNYFNGPTFPTARGANSAADFDYQTDKLVAALSELDADVIGVQELENDYADGTSSSAQDLVDALNADADVIATGRSYTYVTPPTGNLGSDAIATGIIYDQNAVTEVGTAVELDTPGIFDGLNTNRTPIAQTFEVTDNTNADFGEKFTIAVTHFKSKGDGNDVATGANDDQGDGQGNWNQMRTDGANAVRTWLAGNPTGYIDSSTSSADPDILVLGDINAYKEEDPVKAFENNGYTNLVTGDYSFVFDGQWGSLDHAFANSDLAPQVTAGAKWHINADEPDALSYSTEFNDPSLRARDEFRVSDHDPLLIGLDLGAVNIIDGTADRDALIGTAARDIITGGVGEDTIDISSGGNDTVVYTNVRDAFDTISGFNSDIIDLSDIFANESPSITTYGAATSGGYLSFVDFGGDAYVFYDRDGSAGAGRAMPFMKVAGLNSTTLDNASNFAIS